MISLFRAFVEFFNKHLLHTSLCSASVKSFVFHILSFTTMLLGVGLFFSLLFATLRTDPINLSFFILFQRNYLFSCSTIFFLTILFPFSGTSELYFLVFCLLFLSERLPQSGLPASQFILQIYTVQHPSNHILYT